MTWSLQIQAQGTSSSRPISAIHVEGNSKTKLEIILRELTFKVDSLYTIEELQNVLIPRSTWNLQNLNLFNQIDLSIQHDGGLFTILVRVVEKWYLWPIPFVEFADRNFNQWYTFNFDTYRTNYGLYLFKYNAFGKNHTAKLALIDGYNRELGLHYQIPWFMKNNKLGVEIKSKYRTNKEIWYKTNDNQVQFYRDLDQTLLTRFENELTLQIRPRTNVWHKPYLTYHRVSIADTVQSQNLNIYYFSNGEKVQSAYTLGYNWIVERRDNRFFPTAGHFVSAQIGHTLLSNSPNYAFAGLTASVYHRFKDALHRFSFAASIVGKASFSHNLPYLHQRALGYDNVIRGYEYYVIDGSAFALSKTEIRWHLLDLKNIDLRYMPVKAYKQMPTAVFVNAFFDRGYVFNRQTQWANDMSNTHQFGYGVGLNAMFYYDKVFRFEYSFNKIAEHGVKIHFIKAI